MALTINVTNVGNCAGIGCGDWEGDCNMWGNIVIGNGANVTATAVNGAGIGAGSGAYLIGNIIVSPTAKISSTGYNGTFDETTIGNTADGINYPACNGSGAGTWSFWTSTKSKLVGEVIYEAIEVSQNFEDKKDPGVDNIQTIYNPLQLQHGTQANQRINVYINSMQTKDLKGTIPNEADEAQLAAYSNSPEKQAEYQELLDAAKDMTLTDAKVTTVDNAKVAIRVVEGALEYALNEATNMGAYLQRLEYTDANVTTMGENVQNSESTIRDADMAKEMTEYTKYNILSQASQSMLAQANQNSSAVLSLLQ